MQILYTLSHDMALRAAANDTGRNTLTLIFEPCQSGALIIGGKILPLEDGRVEIPMSKLEDGEHAITATYQSGHLDFGALNLNKNLTNILLTADIPGGGLSVSLSDGMTIGEAILDGKPTHAPNIYELRMPSGRFRAASLSLVCGGDQRHRIYRAELYAQKGKS